MGGVVAAVAKLARDRKPALGKALRRLLIARRRRAVEQVHIVLAVLDAVAKNVDDTALADLALQPSQKLLADGAVIR